MLHDIHAHTPRVLNPRQSGTSCQEGALEASRPYLPEIEARRSDVATDKVVLTNRNSSSLEETYRVSYTLRQLSSTISNDITGETTKHIVASVKKREHSELSCADEVNIHSRAFSNLYDPTFGIRSRKPGM